jgi:hypothetical protein
MILVRFLLGLTFLVAAGAPAPAWAGGGAAAAPIQGGTGPEGSAVAASRGVFKICHDQTYALCATASCFVFNGLAYCTCDVKRGDSISLPFNYGNGKDVCSVNAAGAGNGYVVSTFSLPRSVVAPRGDTALYTCPGASSSGAYAQCDGGVCFRSTQGQNFPGSGRAIRPDQIICSCPITVAQPPAAVGYQIAGPYPCQRSFFRNCGSNVANTRTGSTVYVGAPTGTARLLTRLLDGSVPPLNRCPSPAAATLP